MKHTVSTLLVDNLLLFTPGTERFCAIVVQVIFTHGLFLFLPIWLLCWLLLIHYVLCARNYAIYYIILSTSLNTHNNTANQIGLALFKNFPFPFRMPLFFVNVLSSSVLREAVQPHPHHQRKALKSQCFTGRSRSFYQLCPSCSVAKLAFDHKLSDTDLGKVTSLDYIDFLDK